MVKITYISAFIPLKMKSTDFVNMISCPKRGNQFPLTEAIIAPLRDEVQKNVQKEYSDRFKSEKEKLEQQALARAKEQTEAIIKESQEEANELRKKLKEAQDNELELRKKRRDLETKQQEMALELSRKIDEETKKIKGELEKNYTLRVSQQEEQIANLRKEIQELQRKAEQGSQQAQGEALELRLEDILRENFPDDDISPVPKGTKGADVLQKVNSKTGTCCGIIIWESKNTKNWSNSWVDKLKDNQREIKAEIAVLATSILPEAVQGFGTFNDIWVTHWSFAPQLACALRFNLIQMSKLKISSEGKDQKMELLYDYLTGGLFRQRVETIAGAFKRMREDLD